MAHGYAGIAPRSQKARLTILVVLLLVITRPAAGQSLLEFDKVGVQPNRDYLRLQPFEQLDTQNGNIMLTLPQLTLPGNAGHDLQFEFTFNGNGYNGFVAPWSFGLKGFPTTVTEPAYPPQGPALDNTLEATEHYVPSFLMADGAIRRTVFTQVPIPGQTSTMQTARTADFWEYDRSSHQLKMPDGTLCWFVHVDGDPAATLRLLQVQDVFGNLITLTWVNGS